MYHLKHYWPPNIYPLDDEVKWITFFSEGPGLLRFNWKSMLDNHFEHEGFPPLFHYKDIYAFRVIELCDWHNDSTIHLL